MTSWTLFTHPLIADVLLAARKYGWSGRRASRASIGEVFLYLLLAAGVIAAVCLALHFGSRVLHRRRQYSHAGLFDGLCKLHGLDRRARTLLKSLAGARKLPHPARLFTEPGWLDPTQLPGPLRGRTNEVAALRNRLFIDGDG
ncbi:MAG TPA: hypothetical protein VMY42_10845 [Thermoguttaceae bacterium]|nr:hypothetical protein [Thermoguttaceae bacterium]